LKIEQSFNIVTLGEKRSGKTKIKEIPLVVEKTKKIIIPIA
jgi:hypothetical protein